MRTLTYAPFVNKTLTDPGQFKVFWAIAGSYFAAEMLCVNLNGERPFRRPSCLKRSLITRPPYQIVPVEVALWIKSSSPPSPRYEKWQSG